METFFFFKSEDQKRKILNDRVTHAHTSSALAVGLSVKRNDHLCYSSRSYLRALCTQGESYTEL